MTSFPAGPIVIGFVFALAVLATVGGALLAVLTTRVIRSVCGLMICCFGLAGLYYFLHSPFLTLMEILIYVGAICVTIVFAVMLAEPDEAPARESRGAAFLWGGGALLGSGAVFAGLAWLVLRQDWTRSSAPVAGGSIQDLGKALLTTSSFVFELISLLLLVAILGALVIARYGRTRP